MDKIEKQKQHFESISDKYFNARRTRNHLTLKKFLWSYFFRNENLVGDIPFKVLEPMCGYGEGKEIIANHLSPDFEYEGFDYSEPLIAKIKESDPSLNVYVMDVTKYIPQKKYDVIILIGGLHHVPDYTEHVLRKVNEALNPNGYFINYEPTQNNFIMRFARNVIYKKNRLFDQDTERAFELKELNQIYSKTGFKIENQIYPGLLSYILYYNPDAFPLLNIGGERMVKVAFNFDKMFFRNSLGRKFSFTTLTLLKKA